MKAGDMIKFEYEHNVTAYGSIIWIDGETANIEFKNPITKEYENSKKDIKEIIKIGTK